METAHPAAPNAPGESSPGSPRGVFPDAVRFWETRRVLYNLALTAAAVFWIVATWPHFRPAFTLPNFLRILLLALLANVCYSAAYLVDLPMQYTSVSDVWKRRRWILLLVGTLFVVLFEHYWIGDEIYPYVR